MNDGRSLIRRFVDRLGSRLPSDAPSPGPPTSSSRELSGNTSPTMSASESGLVYGFWLYSNKFPMGISAEYITSMSRSIVVNGNQANLSSQLVDNLIYTTGGRYSTLLPFIQTSSWTWRKPSAGSCFSGGQEQDELAANCSTYQTLSSEYWHTSVCYSYFGKRRLRIQGRDAGPVLLPRRGLRRGRPPAAGQYKHAPRVHLQLWQDLPNNHEGTTDEVLFLRNSAPMLITLVQFSFLLSPTSTTCRCPVHHDDIPASISLSSHSRRGHHLDDN